MIDKERSNASIALFNWFESQHLTLPDAIEVMALTIASAVKTIGHNLDRDPNTGARAVAQMITDT